MANLVGRLSLITILLLTGVDRATSQVDTGVLSGYVFDDSGAVIPGAAVTISNVGTNYELEVESNAAGLYVSPPLPPGTYRLTIQQEGFAPAAKEVTLYLSERLAVDFTLQIGSVAETVHSRSGRRDPSNREHHTEHSPDRERSEGTSGQQSKLRGTA